MSVSSAYPDNLQRYASTGQSLNDSLHLRLGALTNRYQAYLVKPCEDGLRVDASEVLAGLKRHIRHNIQNDQWVATVAATFQAADADGGPATVEDAAIAATLAAAGGLVHDPPPGFLFDVDFFDFDPLGYILENYQVAEDKMVNWEPPWPFSLFTDPRKVTRTEAELLDALLSERGLRGLKTFEKIRNKAYGEAKERYGKYGKGAEDGHQDAFRHAYWNALLVREFGPEFAKKFATAHEGVPGNPADKEAMDLYNNEMGRRIAMKHPDASPKKLANLVEKDLERGELVVIDGHNELAYSNQVEKGKTGNADDRARGGGEPAEGADSNNTESE